MWEEQFIKELFELSTSKNSTGSSNQMMIETDYSYDQLMDCLKYIKEAFLCNRYRFPKISLSDWDSKTSYSSENDDPLVYGSTVKDKDPRLN